MKRAQQEASKVYGGSPELNQAFIRGDEKAEEHHALTSKDLQRILEIHDELTKPEVERTEPYFASEDAFYKEVLRRLNETKEKK